jgi:predicted transcriptional regulator
MSRVTRGVKSIEPAMPPHRNTSHAADHRKADGTPGGKDLTPSEIGTYKSPRTAAAKLRQADFARSNGRRCRAILQSARRARATPSSMQYRKQVDYTRSHPSSACRYAFANRVRPMPEATPPLGSTEIEILRHLGDRSPQSVGDVAAHFAATSCQARTTILTLMERLRKKGFLTRKQIGGVYHYSPKVEKHDLLRRLVKGFVDTTLGGSVSPFVAYLSENGPVSADDLAQLKQLVRDLEQQRKSGGK